MGFIFVWHILKFIGNQNNISDMGFVFDLDLGIGNIILFLCVRGGRGRN
jgi:hypothetical protein